MEVAIVPCFKDNYSYLLTTPGSRTAVVVDACETEPVLAALEQRGLSLGAVLSTHHHPDHVGGNTALAERFPGLAIYGSSHDRGRIPGQTLEVADGEVVDVFGLTFRGLLVPGHTLGALAFVGHGAVFTGDTLFAGGCGRLFEGTPAMMYRSLNVVLGALPPETLVYCGHEYTASNLRFAAHLEPTNTAVAERATRVAALREKGEPSVPSKLAEERATNPFMRCDSPEIIAHFAPGLGATPSPEAVLGAIRAAKDSF